MYSVDIYSIGVPYYLVFKKNRNNLKTRPGWAISKKLRLLFYVFLQLSFLSHLVFPIAVLRSFQFPFRNVFIFCRQVALDVCRLRRRHKNLNLVMDKLTLMSSLHQTQPTIQILLSGNEFSGEEEQLCDPDLNPKIKCLMAQ